MYINILYNTFGIWNNSISMLDAQERMSNSYWFLKDKYISLSESEKIYQFLFGVLKLMCNGESSVNFQALAVAQLRSLLACFMTSL